MDTLDDFSIKQKKYIPVFPKASGKPTVYIKCYPFEDDEPMGATGFHSEQITTFSDQLSRYFAIDPHIHIGVDNFIYYQEGDITKFVAPDIYVVFGVDKYPLRRSFYTWAEGAAPVAVFEFLSDSTAHHDRNQKVGLYLNDIGVQEYYIHQPEMDKRSEFSGWQLSPSREIVEMDKDAEGGIFSEVLNLWLRWEEHVETGVRLLRPSLPDETPINTSIEEESLRIQAENLHEEAEERMAAAEERMAKEIQRRKEMEEEIEQLRMQLADAKKEYK
ncbi:Uma2 family endonuclease [Candidatus Poribacteria bacterium]|nr:Uma2 family endonuclease [Candidatus Poribacteria bacterium]